MDDKYGCFQHNTPSTFFYFPDVPRYRAALEVVNEKHANLQSPEVQAEAAAAASEAAPIVAKLRTKALARIRHHLLHRVHALKKPQTNIQIKQNLLLRNAPLYAFLSSLNQASVGSGSSGADVAAEVRAFKFHQHHCDKCFARQVRSSYVNTMSQMYVQKFKGYTVNMKRLQSENSVKKKDLLGAIDRAPVSSSSSSTTSSLMGSVSAIGMGMFGTKRSSFFNLSFSCLTRKFVSFILGSAQVDRVFQLRGRDSVLKDSGQVCLPSLFLSCS